MHKVRRLLETGKAVAGHIKRRVPDTYCLIDRSSLLNHMFNYSTTTC